MKAILTFHSVDNRDSVLSYPVKSFELLMRRLSYLDIPVLSLGELLDEDTSSGVSITFDDGMRSVYQNAFPVLKDYGATAHIFITTNAVGSDRKWPLDAKYGQYDMLEWDDIGKLHEAGIAIDAHTCSHPDMRQIDSQRLEEECRTADEIIEKKIGVRPQYFAYPFGYHNRKVRQFVANHYRASVSTELRVLNHHEDRSALPRLDSYYFQTEKSVTHLFDWKFSQYMRLRWLMRQIRGSQCAPDCE